MTFVKSVVAECLISDVRFITDTAIWMKLSQPGMAKKFFSDAVETSPRLVAECAACLSLRDEKGFQDILPTLVMEMKIKCQDALDAERDEVDAW